MLATPAECALLEWLNTKISQPMLEEISLNDYGEDGLDHLAGIRAQLGPNPPLGSLPWCPRVVLELERWTEPDEAQGNRRPSGKRGHRKRLLACVILLRNAAYISRRDVLSQGDFFP